MRIILTPVPKSEFKVVRWERGVLKVNGLETEAGVIEYDEQLGCSTFSDDRSVKLEVIPSKWVDPTPPPEIDHEAEAAAQLEAQRESWVADRWQMITVLGPERWAVIESFAAAPDAPWGLKAVIANAVTIPRNSQTVDLLAYILGMSDGDVDALFLTAMPLKA